MASGRRRRVCRRATSMHATALIAVLMLAANPLIGDPKRFVDARIEFRQFFCPVCGGLIESEVCRSGDPLLHDIELAE